MFVLCFCLSGSLRLTFTLGKSSGLWGTTQPWPIKWLLFSLALITLHHAVQAYSPQMITQDIFLTHPPCFQWRLELENDYFWMRFCFRRHYSYRRETSRNEGGAANAALHAILQILDILSHPPWERWDKLLWRSGKSELMDFMGIVSCVFMTP